MTDFINNRQKQHIVFIILSIIVICVVGYVLISPANSMTNAVICGLEEHIHTEECYELHSAVGESVLICQNKSKNTSHVHDSFCYVNSVLICPLTEFNHEHEASCYDDDNVLCCAIAVHQHTKNCFSVLNEGESTSVLSCNTPAHQHSESCYAPEITLSAQPMAGSVYASKTDAPDTPDMQLIALPEMDIMPLAEPSVGAIKLEYGININKITLSYASGENWIEVTDGSTELPAEAGYRIILHYLNIPVDDLIAAGGQMLYADLPEWFLPYGTGMMFDGDNQVGTLYATDEGILVVFDDDYLQKNAGQNLSGDITASGTCDWHKVIESGGTGKIPGTGITFTFENNIAQKYAKVEIEKSDPELTEKNGKYYLKYTITVTSLEGDVAVPEVSVKDIFANASYINGYVGISDGLNEPVELSPITEVGRLEMNGSNMVWNIGELEANKACTLTYYAEIADNYVNSLLSNPITNRAYVYAGKDTPYQKDDDSSSFRPKKAVSLQKELLDSPVSNTGSDYLNYKITVSAAEDNSYSLKDLVLKDWFPKP